MINEDQLEQLAIQWFQDMGWSYDRNQIIVLCYGAYLMRVGEELQPMSEGQLRKIFSEGQPDWLGGPRQGAGVRAGRGPVARHANLFW